MNPQEKENGVEKEVKPLCSKDEQCRNMKQLHFTKMSHPQFEIFLENKLNEELVLPTDECLFNRKDKSILLRQLNNLKKVLLRKRTAEFFLKEEEAKASSVLPKKDPEESSIEVEIDLTVDEEIVVKETTTMNALKRSASNPSPEDPPKRKKTIVPEPPVPETETKLQWKLSQCEEFDKAETKEDREKYREIVVKKMKEFNEETSHLKTPGDFIEKYEKSKPFNVFFSTAQDIQKTWNQPTSITFPEILDKSLGEIEKSFYIGGRIDIDWLRIQYLLAGQKSDSFIICRGHSCTGKLPNNMEIYKYGAQFSQIIVLKYINGVRIIFIGGGFEEINWKNVTQLVWISPHLPFLQEGNAHLGESKTEFKKDFISFLMEYKNPWRLRIRMFEWLNLLLNVDFSPINVFFLGSVPGVYRTETSNQWGLGRLSRLLSEHAVIPCGDEADDDADEIWPIFAQVSFISGLKYQKDWFTTEFLATLSKLASSNLQNITQEFKCIYPTHENHNVFIDENRKNNRVNYFARNQKNEQKWFNKFLYQWKTGSKGRNKSVPNGRIYTRISESKKAPWIIITSAGLSDSSWGYRSGFFLVDEQISIFEFHAGIVFFPKFLTGDKTFSVQDFDENGTLPFPIPFDVPPTPYKSTDIPFSQ